MKDTERETMWKACLAGYKSVQINPYVASTPCPRCGRSNMEKDMALNAYSRHAPVYICSECGTDEAMRDCGGEVLPLEKWDLIAKVISNSREAGDSSEAE